MDNDRYEVLRQKEYRSDHRGTPVSPEDALRERARLIRVFVDELRREGFEPHEAVLLAAYQFNY
jgi:hypothetical protein